MPLFKDALSLSFSWHLRTLGWNSLWTVWKYKNKTLKKRTITSTGAIAHPHTATHSPAASLSETRSRKRVNSTTSSTGFPPSEHVFFVSRINNLQGQNPKNFTIWISIVDIQALLQVRNINWNTWPNEIKLKSVLKGPYRELQISLLCERVNSFWMQFHFWGEKKTKNDTLDIYIGLLAFVPINSAFPPIAMGKLVMMPLPKSAPC